MYKAIWVKVDAVQGNIGESRCLYLYQADVVVVQGSNDESRCSCTRQMVVKIDGVDVPMLVKIDVDVQGNVGESRCRCTRQCW